MTVVPANWREQEEVVGALFSPFRSRDVNPLGYDSKMAFWRQELADVCRSGRRALLNWRRLEAEHIVGHHRPSCLRQVFADLRRTGEAITPSELQTQAAVSQSWLSWGTDLLVWRPARYCWRWATQMVWPPPEEEDLVVVAALKELSDSLYRRHQSHLVATRPVTGALVLTERLWTLHESLFSTRTDFQLALLELQRRGNITLAEVDGQQVVKFALEGEIDRPTITDLERGVLRLTTVESSLLEQVEQMESEQGKLHSSAKAFLKKNQKEMAKKQFRQWKKDKILLEKRINTLNNVQGVLQTIDESKHNRKVLDALSRGTAAVKGAFGDVTVDRVDEVVADCAEALEDQEDMQAALARPMSPVDDSEAAEIEAELDQLLSGHTTTPVEPQMLVTDLPSPPSESPDQSREQRLKQGQAARLTGHLAAAR